MAPDWRGWLFLVGFVACHGAPGAPADTMSPARTSTEADAGTDAKIVDAAPSLDATDAADRHSDVVAVYNATDGARCLLTAAGDVVQWTSARPNAQWRVVEELRGVSEIACNMSVACGRSRDGTWSCTRRVPSASPFPIGRGLKVPLEDIDTLVPYVDGICALVRGDLYCWGDLGAHVAMGPTPTRLEIRDVVKFVDSGQDWSLILTRNGDVYCWGRNEEGVCGSGVWYAFVPPHRIATGIVDVVANLQSAWLLRKDGVVLGSGHVSFASRLRKERVPKEPEGDDFFYSDVPIPVTLPGRAKRILRVDCVELESGESGCAYDKWYPRSIEELKPCRAEDGVVKCGEKVVPVRW